MFFWVPMTLFLTCLWLLLSNSIDIGQFLLGVTLSFILVLLSLRMRPDLAYPQKIWLILRLMFRVLADTARSNWSVIKLIFQWRRQDFTSGYVYIPLDIRDPHAIACLACIITFAPGTVWSSLSEKDYILRLHVLDLKEESEWFHLIKHRYEKLLIDIFE